MKFKGFLIINFFILCLLAIGAGYNQKRKEVIPAEHTYIFSPDELKIILKDHLIKLGTNIPNGILQIKGLEIHYNFEHKGNLQLIIKEHKNYGKK